jgi:sugar-specific transcriptional regulator TrmB
MDALKGIGLNLYERRLWVALLARGTSTAGELSEIANVPRSRTYDILQSLAEKGFVVVQTAKPLKYVAIPPEEALERAKKKMEEDIRAMQERIDDLKKSPILKELNDIFTKGLKLVSPEDMTGALKGRYSVYQQMDTMFKDATKKINIVTTPEGLNELFENHFESLKKASNKGVVIKIATTPGEKAAEAIKAFADIAEVRSVNEKEVPISGRFVIVDGKELVFGLTDSKTVHATQDLAIWSKSEHAASNVLEPLFKLVWNHSKPVS